MFDFQRTNQSQAQPVGETSIGAGGWNVPANPGPPSKMPGVVMINIFLYILSSLVLLILRLVITLS